jgi:hypothetical protein
MGQSARNSAGDQRPAPALKPIWYVEGSTGEYSDRHDWVVAVVETEEAAKAYVAALDAQYQSIPSHWHEERWEYEERMSAIMTLDPHFSSDYTGTRYYYGETRLVPDSEIPR